MLWQTAASDSTFCESISVAIASQQAVVFYRTQEMGHAELKSILEGILNISVQFC